MNINEEINIIWLKRDLRLQDNEAILNALNAGKRTLFLYVFEKSLLEDEHYAERHWDFIKQSIVDLNKDLAKFDTKVLCVTTEVVTAFNQILNYYKIDTVFSHQETGLLITYKRDKDFKRYCRNNSIKWKENNNNGVLRGLLNREDWFEKWDDYMYQPLFEYQLSNENFLSIETIKKIENAFFVTNLQTDQNSVFQKGGTEMAWKYAATFFEKRHKNYMSHISKPALARESCSRLSPYIAWGNVSIRQIFHTALEHRTEANKKDLSAFVSRLRWQAHFVQKFEMEHTMEEASVNKGYHKLKKSINFNFREKMISEL